jgi:hypothetical protein
MPEKVFYGPQSACNRVGRNPCCLFRPSFSCKYGQHVPFSLINTGFVHAIPRSIHEQTCGLESIVPLKQGINVAGEAPAMHAIPGKGNLFEMSMARIVNNPCRHV